jgi:hypothetical protein
MILDMYRDALNIDALFWQKHLECGLEAGEKLHEQGYDWEVRHLSWPLEYQLQDASDEQEESDGK